MIDKIEDVQKYGKEQFEAAASATSSVAKAIQVIAAETADYSRRSFESGSAFVEKLLGVKSYDAAIQIQSEYWKTSYSGFVEQAKKMGELYSSLAKEAYKPIETTFSKVYNGKS
ncbi:MAG: phasin family protein [Beijerinckiaceae bacterium]|nr:phasin family protein [Beijerinckiaceae bacterium]